MITRLSHLYARGLAVAVADELVTILGVNVSKDAMAKLESFKNGIDSVKSTLLGLSVVITGFAVAAGIMVKGATDEAAELEKLSEKTGLSTDALQEWAYAAQKAGGDASAVQKDLAGLQERFMTTGKSAEKMLLDISGRMQGMSGPRANALGKAYGLSDDTIALLKKGKEGVEDLRKEAHKLGGIIPADSIKKAADFKRQMTELQFTFHGLTTQAAIAMIPALSKVVEIFKEWLGANRAWISAGLTAFMNGVVQGFERFWAMLKKVGDAFEPIKKALKPFLGDMSATDRVARFVTGALSALLVIFAPVIAKFVIVAGIIKLAQVAFEDFFTYLEGGDSIIGRIINAIKNFVKENEILIKGVTYTLAVFAGFKALGALDTAFSGAKAAVMALNLSFKGLNATMKANVFMLLVAIAIAAAQLIYENWGAISEWFTNLWNKVKATFPDFGEWATKARKKVEDIWEGIKGFFKNLWNEITPDFGSAFDKIKSWLPGGSKTPPEGGTGGQSVMPMGGQAASVRPSAAQASRTTQYNDNKHVNITVSSPDPQQAGQATVQALDNTSNINTPGQYAPVAG